MKQTKLEDWVKVEDSELHCNEILVILGGGISLTKDLLSVRKAERFSRCQFERMAINHHANILLPDYVVVEDRPTVQLVEELREESYILGRHDLADIDISIAPDWNNSGMSALWVADYLQFDEIIMCGFDCWKPGLRYHWHDFIYAPPPCDYPEQRHKEALEAWKEVKEHLKHPERVYAVSGDLTGIFQSWKSEG